MAAEIKMFKRCLHPCFTKFAVQTRISRKPLNLKQTSRTRCDSIFPKSINSNPHHFYHKDIIKNVDYSNNTNQNYFGHGYKGITTPVISQGAGDFTQYAKYLNPISLENSSHNLIKPENNISFLFDKTLPNLNFTPIGPEKREEENLLQSDKKPFDYLKGLPKTLFRRRKNDEKKPRKRIPKLILIQNPFTWLMIKIDFNVLRNIWDPSFTEKEFKFGTKQAISRVTNVISGGQYSELNGLLTKAARLSLMRELDRNWSEKQRSLLALQNDDIQISSPRKVYFIRIADKKYCDVDMAFLALKWAPINSIEALIFTEIFARFHREYTPHCIPEWTIAYFKVTRFEVLRRKPKSTL